MTLGPAGSASIVKPYDQANGVCVQGNCSDCCMYFLCNTTLVWEKKHLVHSLSCGEATDQSLKVAAFALGAVRSLRCRSQETYGTLILWSPRNDFDVRIQRQ